MLKAKIFCTITLLLISTITYCQQKENTESLFKEYLISKDRIIAKQILASNDGLYSIYCAAALSVDAAKKISNYSSFIALQPKYGLPNAYEMRGRAYVSIFETDSALNDFNSALQIDSTNSNLYYDKANAFMVNKQIDSAVKNLDRSIKLNPGYALAYHLRGVCFDDQKKYEDAIADFSKEIKLDKTSDMGYMMRGYVYNETENYKLAIKDWIKAEKLNPDHTKTADDLINKALVKLNGQ